MKVAVDGDSCEAEGHPTVCSEPAQGFVDADGSFTLNGKPIAAHDDAMHFDSHGHDVDPQTGACTDYQSHDVTPEQTHDFTHNGQPVMRVGDTTTDPGSGGTAEIVSSQESEFTHNGNA